MKNNIILEKTISNKKTLLNQHYSTMELNEDPKLHIELGKEIRVLEKEIEDLESQLEDELNSIAMEDVDFALRELEHCDSNTYEKEEQEIDYYY